jgi:hypothetical protein
MLGLKLMIAGVIILNLVLIAVWEFILPILYLIAKGLDNLLHGSEPAYCMPPTRFR